MFCLLDRGFLRSMTKISNTMSTLQINIVTCRRWDLTGIPCSHAISCLRHERISAKSVLPYSYTLQAYSNAYGYNIWPYADMSVWEKANGPEINPPVYDKKVGRPPKSRRKQPHEVQSKFGPKMSKHGVTMNCSYCHEPNHNKSGCKFRKSGINPGDINTETICVESQAVQNTIEKPLITQSVQEQEDGHISSQQSSSMLFHMLEELSQSSRVLQQSQPLPDSVSSL